MLFTGTTYVTKDGAFTRPSHLTAGMISSATHWV